MVTDTTKENWEQAATSALLDRMRALLQMQQAWTAKRDVILAMLADRSPEKLKAFLRASVSMDLAALDEYFLGLLEVAGSC